MSTEKQKVDVLAVLDKHISAERALGYEASAREGELARAAVAELIADNQRLRTALEWVIKRPAMAAEGIARNALDGNEYPPARVGGDA